jgi:hypothetical protein
METNNSYKLKISLKNNLVIQFRMIDIIFNDNFINKVVKTCTLKLMS